MLLVNPRYVTSIQCEAAAEAFGPPPISRGSHSKHWKGSCVTTDNSQMRITKKSPSIVKEMYTIKLSTVFINYNTENLSIFYAGMKAL